MVYTFGESLLDVIIHDLDHSVARPGGAMLNAAVSIRRSGVSVALISELGDDISAGLIMDFLQKNDINTDYIQQYSNHQTAVALAFLDASKKPTYTFIKNEPKERRLPSSPSFHHGDVFLFGSFYALDDWVQPYLDVYLEMAHKQKTLVIYDPNIRGGMNLNHREKVLKHIRAADIIKGSDEDFEAIFDTKHSDTVFEYIRNENKNALLVMTKGSEGVMATWNDQRIELKAERVSVVSTIGAGDGFNAGIAAFLTKHFRNPSKWDRQFVELMMQEGIQCATSVCASDENYLSVKKNP